MTPGMRAAEALRREFTRSLMHIRPEEIAEVIDRETGAREVCDAAKAFLRLLPSVQCSDFHHKPKQRHESHDQCPVIKQYMDALVKLREAANAGFKLNESS